MGDFDLGPTIIGICASMIAISTLAIIIRFWSRFVTYSPGFSRRFWWDDWFALSALPFLLALAIILIYLTTIGYGKPPDQLQPGQSPQQIKLTYAMIFPYNVGTTLVRFSALCFYARIFGWTSRTFRRVLWAVAALNAAFLLSNIVLGALLCTPIQKEWIPETPGSCINTTLWWLSSSIVGIIIDFVVLVLPVPMLWRLHLTVSRKLLVTGAFLCGYCVVGVSIGRLVALEALGSTLVDKITYNGVLMTCYLVAETAISILSVCLPSMFVLGKRAKIHGLRSLLTTRDMAVPTSLSSYPRRTTQTDGASATTSIEGLQTSTGIPRQAGVGAGAVHGGSSADGELRQFDFEFRDSEALADSFHGFRDGGSNGGSFGWEDDESGTVDVQRVTGKSMG